MTALTPMSVASRNIPTSSLTSLLWRLAGEVHARTLNSVPFGILLMTLVASYVAVGSGLAGVREAFEMNELQFFNAWPLKLLVALLVANVLTVTFARIPFTPPRYGVWAVHAGIVTLVFGMAWHYKHKVEGLTLVPVGQTVGHFYDAHERALYTRFGERRAVPTPLVGLPRFAEYDVRHGNVARLDRRSLRGIDPTFHRVSDDGRSLHEQTLADVARLSDPVRLDVVGYYPYATIGTAYEAVEAKAAERESDGGRPGVRLSRIDVATGLTASAWLVAEDGASAAQTFGDAGGGREAEMEHRHLPDPAAFDAIAAAAGRTFCVDVTIDGVKFGHFHAGPGQSFEAGGYAFGVEAYDPAFPMSGTAEIVKTLAIHVTPPGGGEPFRRMILAGKAVQTDFRLNVEGAGPMGQRLTTPIDERLVLNFHVEDSLNLLPTSAPERHLFVTADGSEALLHVRTGRFSPPITVLAAEGLTDVAVSSGGQSSTVMAERTPSVRRTQDVRVVPSAERERDVGMTGAAQVINVRVRKGGWSTHVAVPFNPFPDLDPWRDAATVRLPGTAEPLRLMLGNLRREMPMRVTLRDTAAEPYAGAATAVDPLMRDFRADLTLIDRSSGERVENQARLNSPVYFGNTLGRGGWLLYLARVDDAGRQWTVLGVGNRPGVTVMVAGCVMIGVGLLYAFYAKPYVIRRMKRRAVARHGSRLGTVSSSGRPRTSREPQEQTLVPATR